MPYEKLPKTLQDAFTITTSLVIYHIWINALCIIKNDIEDWSKI